MDSESGSVTATFDDNGRRADTMGMLLDGRVALSPSLPSPWCWKLLGGYPGWADLAIQHLEEFRGATCLRRLPSRSTTRAPTISSW